VYVQCAGVKSNEQLIRIFFVLNFHEKSIDQDMELKNDAREVTMRYSARMGPSSEHQSRKSSRVMPALLWHYLKVAFRKISHQKSHSFINIAGLSVAMACFLIMMTNVLFELSFDRFHEKSDRLYRVAIRNENPDVSEYSIITPQILSENLKARVPEVDCAGIIQPSRKAVIQTETESFIEDGLFADENFLDLFSFEMVRGDPSEALRVPNSMVITDEMAERIFGPEDPVGKSLRYKSRLLSCDLNVTGVMRHPPKNSHVQFNYLVSAATMSCNKGLSGWFRNWDIAAFYTYLGLQNKSMKNVTEEKIEMLIKEARPQTYRREGMIYLQPVTDIHLKSRVEGATATNNRIQSVYLFSGVALLILLIACMNSINLSIALAANRVKEICMRKIIGAGRAQLIRQNLGESYLFAVLAMGLALLIFQLFFPLFSRFMGNGLTMSDVSKIPLILSVLSTLLFVGAFSGIYPAMVLSAFQPFSFLKKSTGSWLRGTGSRNVLVIFQFSAIVALMLGTLVVFRQLNFIRNKKLGYNREHVVIVGLKEEEAVRKAQVLKTSLLGCSGIANVTVSDSNPLRLGSSVSGLSLKKENGETIKIDCHLAQVDHDFMKVFGIEIIEGKDFSRESLVDANSVLVNETFVRKLGWTDPVGMRYRNSTVIGVVEDFHFETLHKEIEPAVFSLGQDFFGGVTIGIRIKPDDSGTTLADIGKIFTQTITGQPFDFYFLDDAFNRLYRNEQRLAATIGYLEILAVILGCMGLFGLATHATQRRTKEIGIRKVLGASVFNIVRMMSREFLALVLISNIIAWPLGYYFLRRWLQGYAYRCALGFEAFLLTGLATLIIALFAVGLHTVRAACSNPLESIRYE
jgi:putative ABC transport system permease protein